MFYRLVCIVHMLRAVAILIITSPTTSVPHGSVTATSAPCHYSVVLLCFSTFTASSSGLVMLLATFVCVFVLYILYRLKLYKYNFCASLLYYKQLQSSFKTVVYFNFICC